MERRRSVRLASVLLALGLAGTAAPAVAQSGGDAATADLRPLWREGQSATYRIKQTRLDISKAQSRSAEVETRLTARVSWRIVEADEAGGGTAELVIDKIDMQVTGPDGKTVRAGGGSERSKSMRKWAEAMSGKPLEVSVGPEGSIESIDGHEAIRSAAGKSGKRMTENYFKGLVMDTALLVGGSKGTEVGDTWSNEYTSPHQMGELAYESTYKLAGIERIAGIRVASVERRSELELSPDLSDLPADGPKIDVEQTAGTETAQIMFDLSRHEIVGAHFEQTLAVEVSINARGQSMTSTTRRVTSTQVLRTSEN